MPQKTRKNSLRLQGFNYATGGAYFITICCQNRQSFFGRIEADQMVLSPIGEILQSEWKKTDEMWEDVHVDTWVIMPNHFHALIWFVKGGIAQLPGNEYLPQTPGYQNLPVAPSANLSSLVRGFKGAVTRVARHDGFGDFGWQRSFHDRIIRDDHELKTIRTYILNNPANWVEDDLYL